MALFNACARVVVGNGKICYFWFDKWLNGKTIEELAPEVVKLIPPLNKAGRTVADAMINITWIDAIKKAINIRSFLQIRSICRVVTNILFPLHPDREDAWSWFWNPKGFFTTKYVYLAHFTA